MILGEIEMKTNSVFKTEEGKNAVMKFYDELKLLTMPIVLFVGAKDIMLHSDKTAKRLGNLLPHAQINILPEAGHSNVNDVDKIIEWMNLH
jgi:pimeloyl-ACP methyl ester carboxylesterase